MKDYKSKDDCLEMELSKIKKEFVREIKLSKFEIDNCIYFVSVTEKEFDSELYTFKVDNKKFSLTLDEMKIISFKLKEIIEKRNSAYYSESEIKVLRHYNKKGKILTLFNAYYNPNITKKAVFERISKELDITYKAVEKTYYTK